MWLHQTTSLMHSKGNNECNEEASFSKRETIHKLYIWQGINIQNTQGTKFNNKIIQQKWAKYCILSLSSGILKSFLKVKSRIVVTRGWEKEERGKWRKVDLWKLSHSYIGVWSSSVLLHRRMTTDNNYVVFISKSQKKEFWNFSA
jgi:hypothetical protein